MNGDTTVNNVQYHKLYLETKNTNNPQTQLTGFLREQNKEVYYIGGDFLSLNDCCDNTELLLYDFNTQVGDTIVHTPDSILYSVVLDIDSVQIDGIFRKRYIVNNPKLYSQNPDYIIEGIGSVKSGLLGSITDRPTCLGPINWEHICFEENGIVKYLNPAFSGCSSTQRLAGIHEIPSEKQRNIEISAVEGVLSLHSTTQDIRSIKLVTPNGSLLFEDNSVRESSYKKQLNYRGVLFCIIGFENGEVSTEKILVK